MSDVKIKNVINVDYSKVDLKKLKDDLSKCYSGTAIWQAKLSEWQCELFGCGKNGLVITPLKGKEPNFFWRWMQYICFGNRWYKRSDK